jgi:nudix-type nucleoside diphosphatase (YffH/AdpP family)
VTAGLVRILGTEVLHRAWSSLTRYRIDLRLGNGTRAEQIREVYDRGDGAAILLFNRRLGTVVLVRQFRIPVFVRGEDGPLIEACAGLLDGDEPEDCIRREAEEETGLIIGRPRRILDLWMSPGSVAEKLAFFVAEYDPARRSGPGGGAKGEGEDIEVLELPFSKALELVRTGEIRDAKTVILLMYAEREGLMQTEPGEVATR